MSNVSQEVCLNIKLNFTFSNMFTTKHDSTHWNRKQISYHCRLFIPPNFFKVEDARQDSSLTTKPLKLIAFQTHISNARSPWYNITRLKNSFFLRIISTWKSTMKFSTDLSKVLQKAVLDQLMKLLYRI